MTTKREFFEGYTGPIFLVNGTSYEVSYEASFESVGSDSVVLVADN